MGARESPGAGAASSGWLGGAGAALVLGTIILCALMTGLLKHQDRVGSAVLTNPSTSVAWHQHICSCSWHSPRGPGVSLSGPSPRGTQRPTMISRSTLPPATSLPQLRRWQQPGGHSCSCLGPGPAFLLLTPSGTWGKPNSLLLRSWNTGRHFCYSRVQGDVSAVGPLNVYVTV